MMMSLKPIRKAVIRLAAVLALAGAVVPARGQDTLELFDAHLHYNQEPAPFYSLDRVLELFRRNNVTGILATSRPNKGTHQLMESKAPGLAVVPFLRPYRVRGDIQSWFRDSASIELIREEMRHGYYRGIGEFHVHGRNAATDTVKQIVDFAVDNNLMLHAHCDEEALLILYAHNPKVHIIWAHTGFFTPPDRVRQLLEEHPDALWGELSYRSGITDGSGKLSTEWRALFAKHPTRFLIGSDTWINERWASYDAIMRDYRNWLAQLPPDQAKAIAHGNARRLFGLN